MEPVKVTAIATIVIGFSTFLGVMFGGIYYLYLILQVNLIGAILGGIVYIDINLLFLYILKKRDIFK